MKRRLRKHPQHHPADGDTQRSNGRRLPYGLMWLALTVLVLILVIVYDRRSISQAEAHIKAGQELETQGQYVAALNEYDQAFENRRLGRKAKAGVALSMADIYYNHMEDYPSAHRFYVQAKQISQSVVSSKEIQERARIAAKRAKGAGVFKPRPTEQDGVTTQTIVQRVELLDMPQSDRQGPVVATYDGGEIHAGQLLRALEKRPEFLQPDFRESPKKLQNFLDGLMRDTLAYEAAVRVGVNKDPDVSTRLYDYQKTLVTQRYLVDRREQAMIVDNNDVEKYYREHINDYVEPGRVSISLIKSDSETSAAEQLQMLRDGQRFEDVATSYSVDKKSASKGGVIGQLTEKDTTIPGVGEAPKVIDGLFKLPMYSVSEVTRIGDAYYIFKVTGIIQARNVTLDEARGKIENILRGRAVDHARMGLDKELNEAFEPQISEDGLKRFWDFAREHRGLHDEATSGTSAAKSSPADAKTSGAAKTQ